MGISSFRGRKSKGKSKGKVKDKANIKDKFYLAFWA